MMSWDLLLEVVGTILFLAPLVVMVVGFFMFVNVQTSTSFQLQVMDACFMEENLDERQECMESLDDYLELKSEVLSLG